MAGYGGLLQQLAAGPAAASPLGAPPPAGARPGLGAPPSMPGLPPAPTGIGKMDTGLAGGSPREAASDAVLKLRDLKAHFPALAPRVDGWIAEIVAAGKPGGAAGMPGANDGASLGDAPAPAAPTSAPPLSSDDAL
jgi:hypothetical protein